MTAPRAVGGSRYLYDSFAASARIEANERIAEIHFATLEARLTRIEKVMERLEKRLWLTIYGVAAVVMADGVRSIMALPLN